MVSLPWSLRKDRFIILGEEFGADPVKNTTPGWQRIELRITDQSYPVERYRKYGRLGEATVPIVG